MEVACPLLEGGGRGGLGIRGELKTHEAGVEECCVFAMGEVTT